MSKSNEPRVYNTRRFQIFELMHFMLNEHEAIFDGVGFTSAEYENQYTFDQAVTLFNEREDKDIGNYIIDRVKLRYCKKTKSIICTSHLVKFTESHLSLCDDMDFDPLEGMLQLQRGLRLR